MVSNAAFAQRTEAEADGSVPDEHARPSAESSDTDIAVAEPTGNTGKIEPAERDDAANAETTDAETTDAETTADPPPTGSDREGDGIDGANEPSTAPGRPRTEEKPDLSDLPEPEAADSEPEPRTALRMIDRVAAIATALLLLAAIAGAATWNSARADESETRAAVNAARDAATALTTIKFGSAQGDVQTVIDRSTGEFAAMFTQNLDSYVKLVEESRIDTAGQVIEAGVESRESNTVRALVAVRSTVRNLSVPNGEERQYRMKLEMTKEGDRWLVSRVDFLQ